MKPRARPPRHRWVGSPRWQRCSRSGCDAVRLLRGVPGDKRTHYQRLLTEEPPARQEPPCGGDIPADLPVHVNGFDPTRFL